MPLGIDVTGEEGDAPAVVSSPSDIERAGDGGVLGTTIAATFVDDARQISTVDSTSIDAGSAGTAIADSPAETATLSVSGLLTSEENTAALADSTGWSDLAIVTSSAMSFDTSATFVVPVNEEIAVGATGVAALASLLATTSGTGSAGGSLAPLSVAGTDIGSLVVVAPSNDTPTLTAGSSTGSNMSEAAATSDIDATVTIIGSPTEGTTLTASVVTSGFTGTTDLEWQRFYDGSWFDIPVELSPYSSGEVLTYVTAPTYVVREEDEVVSGIRVEATLVDSSGVTDAVVDSPSVGPILASPATLSLSAITGTPTVGATLTVSGLVTSEDFTGSPVFNWERYYSGGWWDIPIELSPYSSGEALTYVTTPTYVVRAEDEEVLAIRVEATYIDNTGQTFTAFSDLGTDGAELTIVEPPLLTAANVTLGEDVASVALAITDATFDTEYSLGNVTISGVPTNWSLSGDGAESIAAGTWTAGSDDLADLVIVPPAPGTGTFHHHHHGFSFTLGVTASESAMGPTGVLTATATASFAVAVSAVAEAPTFSPTTSFLGAESVGFTLTGLSVAGDSDDTLSATLSGVPSGWTIVDPGVATIVGTSDGASGIIPAEDLGSLVVFTPDLGGESPTLTLTVTSSEGGSTATGSELLTLSATGTAELPTLGATTMWIGSQSGITLTGLSAVPDDGDDTLGVTLTELSPGWTLVDPQSGSSFTATSITGIPVSDLGSLVMIAPTAAATETDVLTLTVGSSEGANTTYASEVLTVVALPHSSGAASAENVSFAIGAAGTLTLDQSASFTGAVSGFAAGDAIDLTDLAFASNMALSYTDNGAGGGTLTVDNGTKVVDLALLGQYAAAGFQAHSDPGGGTLITYSPQTSATDVASLTNPNH